MPAINVPFKEWVSDWRSHAKMLDSEDGGRSHGAGGEHLLAITGTWREYEYEVLRVLQFNPAVDGGRKVSRIASRDFDNKVALYSHRTRDTGIARVITNKGRPAYIIEQGKQALEWAAVAEGMSIAHLSAATREGAIGLGHLPRILLMKPPQVRQVRLKELAEVMRRRIFDAEQDIAALRSELRAVEHEIEQHDK